jgi:5-methylcytosine-specific restriction endonuclease McrA
MANTYDYAWQRLRKRHLQGQPMCVRCGGPGQDVDHVVSVKRAPQRRLDPTNLQTMCHSCHSKATNAHDHPRLNPDRGAAESGAPLDPAHPWHKTALGAGEITATDLTRWYKGKPSERRWHEPLKNRRGGMRKKHWSPPGALARVRRPSFKLIFYVWEDHAHGSA